MLSTHVMADASAKGLWNAARKCTNTSEGTPFVTTLLDDPDSDVKASRPDWPRGQKFGLGFGLGLELLASASTSRYSGLGLEVLVSASNQNLTSRSISLLIILVTTPTVDGHLNSGDMKTYRRHCAVCCSIS